MTAFDERPSLALVNGNILTLDVARPLADTVLVTRNSIVWVGRRQDLSPSALANSPVIDCNGLTVVPGFIDAHCHILAYAASLTSVDCSPSTVSSIGDIQNELKRRAEHIPRGAWIRATGYSDFDLQEKRHPTRWDIDKAVPFHPVRLQHRSGHACVLNSLALERTGVDSTMEEPPGGTIARDFNSGEPNGLLLEMDEWLEGRIPRIASEELAESVSRAGKYFVSQGVTSVEDATASNSPGRLKALASLVGQQDFSPHLYVMPAAGLLNQFSDAAWSFGESKGRSVLGHAKIMLTLSSGRLFPGREKLNELIAGSHKRGFPVAIHAVDSEAVIAASRAIALGRDPRMRDRIEHASECPVEALDALAASRAVVVSQPRFLRDSGDRFLHEFGPQAGMLYRFRALAEKGLVLAASSDAPVSRPSPLAAMQAAITRESNSGQVIGRDEYLTATQALEMHTVNAAYAICNESVVGTITPGKRADLVALSEDPTSIAPECIEDIRVAITIVNGSIVWQA